MKTIYDIQTPCNVAYEEIINNNISKMQIIADNFNNNLFPHFKTHKSVYMAEKQIKAGASGITVATLEEAEVLVKAGIKKIIIAYPVVGSIKYLKLLNLISYADFELTFDSEGQIRKFDEFFSKRTSQKIPFYIKIDVGLNRVGIKLNNSLYIIVDKLVSGLKTLFFTGFLSHSGKVYSCNNIECVKNEAIKEFNIMKEAREKLSASAYKDIKLSLGSTPAIKALAEYPGIDSLRPGNYIYNDGIGIALGVSSPEDCGFRVISQVICKRKDTIIIDAGSKSLGLDRGAHSAELLTGYGFVMKNIGSNEIDDTMQISRLSEEHGIINFTGKNKLNIGDYVEIIPNHSCYVANLKKNFYLVKSVSKNLEVVDCLPVGE